ncbi:MAG: hypothetical protein KA253_01550, partial [Campylobacteraceae bacterium]|nr:hypothetical protein [Campylobacteraceae bacterium]
MLENKTGSICFFSHSSSLSGAERSLLDLITLLISRGVVCSVVIPGEGPLENELKRLGVLVKKVSSIAYWCNLGSEAECYEQLWH